MGTLLRTRYCATFHEDSPIVYEDIDIIIENGIITKIGTNLQQDDHEIIELKHHIVIPGLINTHNHTAMTLFRGYADDTPLQDWLENYIWPKEAELDRDTVYTGAKFAAVEALMSGTTTINSMYWYPQGEADAFTDIGVRLMIGPPLISGVSNLDQSMDLISSYHGKNDDLTRISLNPHAPYTVTAEDYKEIVRFKNEYNSQNNSDIPIKIHTHLAEGSSEMDLINGFASEKGFDLPEVKTPVEYLDYLDVLDQDLIAAHVVECNRDDLKRLKQNQVGIATNISSNMKLGHNIPHIDRMVDQYTKVGLGTDGPSSNNNLDMFETMKLSALAIKSKENNPTLLPAHQILKLATHGGAMTLGWDNIGAIKIGYKADLIAIDLKKPHLRPISSLDSILSHLVYSANGGDVSHVMVEGKWKMIDRELQEIDLDQLLQDFDEVAENFLDDNKSEE